MLVISLVDEWEENFMASKDNEVDGKDNGDEDESEQEDQPPQLTSSKDAIASIEQVQHFLEF